MPKSKKKQVRISDLYIDIPEMEQIKRKAISKTAGILAERLNILNSQNYVKQSDISTELGISATMYNKYRRGKAVPKGETLILIAKHFGVTTDYLLGLSDTQSVKEDIKIACKVTGLSGNTIQRFIDLKPQYSKAIDTFFDNQYSHNILTAIKTAVETEPYTQDELMKFNDIRVKKIEEAMKQAREQGLNQFATPDIMLLDIEYSPIQQASATAQKYLNYIFDEITETKHIKSKGESNGNDNTENR